jgi:hypothetical protein
VPADNPIEQTARDQATSQAKPRRDRSGFFYGAEKRFDSAADTARGLTLTPPKKITANDGAGFLGGLLLYVLALNYLRYGKDGVKGWLGAKFVNRPWMPPDDSGAEDGGRRGGNQQDGSAQT